MAGSKDTMVQQWDCRWDYVKVAENADTTIQHKHIWVCAWVANHNMLGVSRHLHVRKCVCTAARSKGHRCTSMRGRAKGRQQGASSECAHSVQVSRQREAPAGEGVSVSVLPGSHASRNDGNTGVSKCLGVSVHAGECKSL